MVVVVVVLLDTLWASVGMCVLMRMWVIICVCVCVCMRVLLLLLFFKRIRSRNRVSLFFSHVRFARRRL